VVGLDPNEARLSYARAHAEHHERYVAGRAEDLPFADRSFDCVVSVTALCFIGDQRKALAELVRVTRRRLVIGVLNRHSLLFLWKGRKGGSGGYAGAQWHTAGELRRLLASAQVNDVTLRTAILAPGSSVWARALERWWPQGLPAGGFLAAAGSPPRVPTCVVPGGTPTADV
jgi:ubiquinone/menaquinone biosynthesis C-methylase UbiE